MGIDMLLALEVQCRQSESPPCKLMDSVVAILIGTNPDGRGHGREWLYWSIRFSDSPGPRVCRGYRLHPVGMVPVGTS